MNLIFPLMAIRGLVLAYPSGMRLENLFLLTSACLLSSCGSALPEFSGVAEKDKRELSNKSPPHIARGEQDNSKQGLSSSACAELNIGLVELSTQALAGQSLRIPQFSGLLYLEMDLKFSFQFLSRFIIRLITVESSISFGRPTVLIRRLL